MALQYRIYKNNNTRNSSTYGKWYARAVMMDTVTTDQLAEVIEANCSVKRSDVLAVLSELVVVMKTELQNSKRVKLNHLGTFKLGINTTGSDALEDFSVAKNVKTVKVMFQPEIHIGADGRRSKALLDGCRVTELPKNDVQAGNDSTTGETEAGTGTGA